MDDDYWRNVKATNSDHASDMASVSDKTFAQKMVAERRYRGLKALEALSAPEYQAIIGIAFNDMVRSIGGVLVWLQMSREEGAQHEIKMRHDLVQRMGQAALDALSPAERADVTFFVKAGCCMHKDLNAVVYGNTRMMGSWAAQGLTGPMK
ncbi:hypothetical protein EXIGLDRAFT_607758, partial [Exidia glandulosa HHB12029]